MTVAADLLSANFACNQGPLNPQPNTLASAATIAPTNKLTLVTGTVQVETITPPLQGYHSLTLLFTNASPGAFLTSGNIITAYQPVVSRPITLHYYPQTGKYYVDAVV